MLLLFPNQFIGKLIMYMLLQIYIEISMYQYEK